MLEDIFRGLLIGILVGIVLVYSLRPKVPYPKWMTVAYDQPWIFILLFCISLYALSWDRLIGSLLLIITTALLADQALLVRDGQPKHITLEPSPPMIPQGFSENVERSTIDTEGPSPPVVPAQAMNYPMFAMEEEYQPGHPAPF